jgi:hypothetical protein
MTRTHCGEGAAPEVCLALEASLCFPTSVAVTRFMLQDELRLRVGELSSPEAPVDVALVSGVLVHATGHDLVSGIEMEILEPDA